MVKDPVEVPVVGAAAVAMVGALVAKSQHYQGITLKTEIMKAILCRAKLFSGPWSDWSQWEHWEQL